MRSLSVFCLAILVSLSLLLMPSCKKNDSSGGGGDIVIKGKWYQTSGPGSGNIYSVGIYGNNIYAGVSSFGVYSTHDLGKTWTNASGTTIQGAFIEALSVHQDSILAGADGIYRTTDGGATWTQLGADQIGCCVTSIDWKGRIIVLNTYTSSPIFVSPDNGTTWRGVGTGLPEYNVTCSALSGGVVFAGTDGQGIFKSADTGKTYIPCSTGLTSEYFTALYTNQSRIFACSDQGMYYSDDQGGAWHLTSYVPLQGKRTRAITAFGNEVFAATDSLIVYSADNGTTWSIKNQNANKLGVLSLAYSTNDLVVGTMTGVYVSTDLGHTLTPIGVPTSVVYSLCSVSNQLFAATGGNLPGLYASIDNAESWRKIQDPLISNGVNMITTVGTDLFAGSSGMVLISHDNGGSWSSSAVGSNEPIECVRGEGNHIYLSSYYLGIMYSEDHGATWATSSLPYPEQDIFYDFLIADEGVYACTYFHGVIFSEDHGKNWSLTGSGLPSSVHVYCMVKVGNSIFAGTSQGLYISGNQGNTWSLLNGELAGMNISSITLQGSYIYVVADGNMVYRSTNNGTTWVKMSEGLPSNLQINTVYCSGGWLFIGTYGDGVWRRSL